MDSPPFTAPLDNPLYYLENFRTVLAWVGQHHADLLTGDERARLTDFEALPRPAQALLVRMVMRTGTLFRRSRLRYPEIERLVAPDWTDCRSGFGRDRPGRNTLLFAAEAAPAAGFSPAKPGIVDDALATLARDGWIDPAPALTLEALFGLLTRPELAEALGWAGVKRGMTKQAMLAAASAALPEPAPLAQWWPGTADRVVALLDMPLFDRVRLLFFGNLRQDWSAFVLTELGHQRYETVPFTPASRAFQRRDEVDRYLHLHACRERLEADEPLDAIRQALPRAADPNPWLENRRGRVLHALGCKAERQGDQALALRAWSESSHREARLRRLRLMERRGEHAGALVEVEAALAAPRCGAERHGLERLRARLARRLNPAAPRPPRPSAIPAFDLALAPRADAPVETVAAAYLGRDGSPVYYVENRLFNGLFALLCWPALYAPLPGAFFHPFHAAPADIDREDFVARREGLFDECLAALVTAVYRTRILTTWQAKRGITSPFVHWPTLSEELLQLALARIPAAHLDAIFRRMLRDLRENRAGLPDLIQFEPARYRLIEVKAPGDRLQDHQRRWLSYCRRQGIEVAVCRVHWETIP